jgi:hypothetical protein
MQAKSNNQYVSADNAGANPLIANRGAPSTWETFIFYHQGAYWAIESFINSEFVALQASNGEQLVASITPSGVIPDVALFSIIPALSSVDITKASQVKLVSASTLNYITTDGDTLVATGTSQSAVTFNVAAQPGGYSLQNAANSFYTSAENAGASPLVANRGAASTWETFAFVAQPGNCIILIFGIVIIYRIITGSVYAIIATINNEAVAVQSNNLLVANVPNGGSFPSTALFYVVSA